MIPSLRKHIAVKTLEVLQSAFSCNATTAVGSWVDDGGQTNQVTVRSVWSPKAKVLPEIAVQARLGRIRGSSSHIIKSSSIVAGQLHTPIYGVVIDGCQIRCVVSTENEDTASQLSDLVFQIMWGSTNASGVPYFKMLANRGIVITDQAQDIPRQERQGDDPSRGPIVFVNEVVTLCRVSYTFAPTATSIGKITLNPATIEAPPLESAVR